MSLFPSSIAEQAKAVVDVYGARGWMVATAESCTGGLIAGALTEIAGSSSVVDRGFVTYSNQAKIDMLGVQASTLENFGAVSRETALQMAGGAVMRSSAHVSVAVTGIAGPGGGSPDKPVGLVHLAAATRGGRMLHREMRYGEIGREAVRLATIETAFEMLIALAETAEFQA